MSEDSMLSYVLSRLPETHQKERLEAIATGAGVPFHTLLKIAKGETVDPRVSTVQLLHDYLKAQETRAAA